MGKSEIPKGRQKGHIRKCVGIERMLDGSLVPARFYLGKAEAEAEKKYERIRLEWARLEADGHKWSTDEALQTLIAEGVVGQKKLRNADAARLMGEPMNAAELTP